MVANRKWSAVLVLACGAGPLCLGFIVMTGWYAQALTLLRIQSGFVPMQIPALGIFLSGIGLLALLFNSRPIAMLAAILTLALGLFVLGDYLLRFDFKIGIFFAPEMLKISRDGRIAPNAAFCLVLMGLAILFWVKPLFIKPSPLLSGLLGAVICALGIVAASGYFLKIPAAYTWPNVDGMPFHSAIGFAFLGMGLSIFSWRNISMSGTPQSLPLLASLTGATLTLVLWQLLIAQEQLRVERSVKLELARIKKELNAQTDFRINDLSQLSRDWELHGVPAKTKWEAQAKIVLDHFGNCEAIEQITPDFEATATARRKPISRKKISRMEDRRERAALEAARDGREIRLNSSLTENKLWINVPVFQHGQFQGFVVGTFRVREFLDDILKNALESGYSLTLSDESKNSYNFDLRGTNVGREPGQEWSQSTLIDIAKVHWQLRLWPRTEILAQELSRLPSAALVVGILISGWAGIGVKLAQTSRRRSFDLELANQKLQEEMKERARIENTLRSSALHFRSVTQSAIDAIISLGKEGQVIFWNKAATDIFQYREDEILGQPLTRIMPERYRERHLRGLEQLKNTDQLSLVGKTFELEGLRKDGTEFPVELSLSSWTSGENIFYTGIVRDITERKRAQEELRSANDDLELRVQQRSVELIGTNLALAEEIAERKQIEEELRRHRLHLEQLVAERTRELQEINDELQSFSYSVSHDLRAPLRAMQGFADALIEDYSVRLDAVGRDYAKRIVRGAQRMDKLIQDLLGYSRVSRANLELSNIDLERALAEGCQQLESEISERRARFSLERPLPQVYGHYATLVQILTNLLSNAVKFTATEITPEVRVHAELRDDVVRLWIEDNGIGIDPSYHQRIFGVFERLHGSETYPGTGIGLAIVRKGLERMGGKAGVESAPNQGSKFWIELPQIKEKT